MIQPLLAIACKDLRVLVRDRMALFWALGFPVAFALFFGSIMKVGPDAQPEAIAVVLVARAGDPQARHTARALAAAGLQVTIAGEAAARAAVRRGEAAALVDLPAASDPRPARLGIDVSRRAEADVAASVLRLALLHPHESIALPEVETFAVTETARGPQSGYQAVFPAMILWGLIGCAAAFAVALVAERSSGALLRLYAAPFGRSAIMGGKALACALACLSCSLLLSALAVTLLGVAVDDPLKYGAALLCGSSCFVGITQLLSVLGRSEQAVAGAGWSALIGLAMAGGAMVPAMLMPDWLRALGAWSPVRWAIDALEGATFRASSWAELAPELLLLALGGLTCFALSALILRVREV